MEQKVTMNDVLNRIGYIRNKSNLSARELSLRLGMSPQYITKIENELWTLSVKKLLEILENCDCSFEKFAYHNIENYDIDMEILTLLKNMNKEKKEQLLAFLKDK